MFFNIDLEVVRICDKILKLLIEGLKECEFIWNDCVIYSRNRCYVYKCNIIILFMDK